MKNMREHKFISVTVLAAIFIVTAFFALRYGSSHMGIKEFFMSVLFKDKQGSIILYGIRLPRVLGGIISGAGLSLSGLILQKVTGNDLAAPNIIGVNAGAGFAVILFLFFLPELAMYLPFAAFLGAVFSTFIICAAAKGAGGSKSSLILSGVAFTAVLNAAISFISLLDTDVLSAYNYFSVGGLSSVKADELVIPGIIVLICMLASLLLSGKIELLCLGDGMAGSLGINVGRLRVICLVIASASAAAAVSFAGLLGFVGLVAPHIARKISPAKTYIQIINSALCGGIAVVLGDLLGRVLFAPSEIPVGIMMALVGAPFFFWLLIRKRRRERA